MKHVNDHEQICVSFFNPVDDSKMEAEINTLFKVVHKSPFNIGVQALLLLKQVLGER